MTKTADCHIAGRVQGVWFRGWTEAEARRRGLSGWVRNEADGSVRALLTGPDTAVDEMIAALHRGPPAARVDTVATRASQDTQTGPFRIQR